MSGAGQPTIGRRVVDVFKGLSEHNLFPNVQSIDSSSVYMQEITVSAMLMHLGLEKYISIFLDIPWQYVSELTSEKLLSLGVRDPDHISMIKGSFRSFFTYLDPANTVAILKELPKSSEEYKKVCDDMHRTIVKHENDAGGRFTRYNIIKIETIENEYLAKRYMNRRAELYEDRSGCINEQRLYHGTPFVNAIVNGGFQVSLTKKTSYFGSGIYFSNLSSKSNRFVFGGGETGCPVHGLVSCYTCPRQILICKVSLGVEYDETSAFHFCRPPYGHDSVHGMPSVPTSSNANFLEHEEFVIYENYLALPILVVTYLIVNPDDDKSST